VTDALDADSDDASEGELADSAWLLTGNDHPPEYCIRQWREVVIGDEKKDYGPSKAPARSD